MITVMMNDKEVVDAVNRLQQAARDCTALTRNISELMLEDVRENFDRQGRPDAWVDLDATTKAARQKRKKWPGKILQDSGTLKNTIFPSADQSSASVTAPAEYAAIHNFGGFAGRNRSVEIPQREFMVLGDDAQEEIGDLVLDHLKNAFNGS